MAPGKLRLANQMRARPTPAEACLWKALHSSGWGVRFLPQVPAFGYILDFYAASIGLAIEVDGPIHVPAADLERDRVLGTHRIATLRFTNDQVLHDLHTTLAVIRQSIIERRHELDHATSPAVRRAAAQLRSAYKRQLPPRY
jgi:leucyl-tRNA synthetase